MVFRPVRSTILTRLVHSSNILNLTFCNKDYIFTRSGSGGAGPDESTISEPISLIDIIEIMITLSKIIKIIPVLWKL